MEAGHGGGDIVVRGHAFAAVGLGAKFWRSFPGQYRFIGLVYLIISVRTVSTHVGNILNKTGAANRAEAATYANQQGLIMPVTDYEV